MKRSFKVNLEEYKDEDDLKLFLNFIERNKNNIKVIHNNKIKFLENEIITKKSKVKFILLNNHQSYQIKYNIRNMDKYKNKKIFGKNFLKNNYSKCFILYKDIIFPLQEYFSSKYLNIEKDKKLEIKLISFENISDFSYMFDSCESLEDFAFFQNNENNIIKNIPIIERKTDNTPEVVNDNEEKMKINNDMKIRKSRLESKTESTESNVMLEDYVNKNYSINQMTSKVNFSESYDYNDNNYLNSISSIDNKCENNTFSCCNIIKEKHLDNLNIKDNNKLVDFNKLNIIF